MRLKLAWRILFSKELLVGFIGKDNKGEVYATGKEVTLKVYSVIGNTLRVSKKQ